MARSPHVIIAASSGRATIQPPHCETWYTVGRGANADARRRVQELEALLRTVNRNYDGPDSLEQTLIEELTDTSVPVLAVGNTERLRTNRIYRNPCAERVVEIAVALDGYRGTPQLFIL